jgi:hypothetical protein
VGYSLFVFAADFEDDPESEELSECEVDDFCDLAFFLSSIDCNLVADRYPTLMRLWNEDSGQLTVSEVGTLQRELQEIADAFRKLPSERMKTAFNRVAEAHTPAQMLCNCAQERFDDPLSRIITITWSPDDIGPFGRQLHEIAAAFRELPPDGSLEAPGGSSARGKKAESLHDCFQDANGANLFDCLLELCAVAIKHDRPIKFQ